MSLPTKIKIGYRTYDLEFLDDMVRDIAGINGAHNAEDAKILVSSKLDDQETAMVLLHECMHGIFRNADLPDDKEEQYVTLITYGLCSLMQDNPELIDYIKENL